MAVDTNLQLETEFEKDGDDLALFGSQCQECDKVLSPPKTRCSACGSGDVEQIQFDEIAELETFTIVRSPQKGFEAPYAAGFVRLSPGDVRMFTPIVTDDFDDLEIGMSMQLTTMEIRKKTNPDETWAFQPAGGAR